MCTYAEATVIRNTLLINKWSLFENTPPPTINTDQGVIDFNALMGSWQIRLASTGNSQTSMNMPAIQAEFSSAECQNIMYYCLVDQIYVYGIKAMQKAGINMYAAGVTNAVLWAAADALIYNCTNDNMRNLYNDLYNYSTNGSLDSFMWTKHFRDLTLVYLQETSYVGPECFQAWFGLALNVMMGQEVYPFNNRPQSIEDPMKAASLISVDGDSSTTDEEADSMDFGFKKPTKGENWLDEWKSGLDQSKTIAGQQELNIRNGFDSQPATLEIPNSDFAFIDNQHSLLVQSVAQFGMNGAGELIQGMCGDAEEKNHKFIAASVNII